MSHAPTTRLLAALELLQTHTRISGPELARRLEVDPRTLRRYISGLEALGIPVVAERGRDGGYGLVAGFKLPPMMFSNDEAMALSLGLLAARGLGLADAAPAVASAAAKLERVLPTALKHRVRAVEQTVRIDSRGGESLADSQLLATLTGAAQAQQQLQLDYRDTAGRDSQRAFDAYGLGFRGGRWYVVGHCHLRADLRSFRLDRITQVRLVPRSFARPDNFDALAHLSGSLARLPRRFQAQLLLHTDLARARTWLFDTLGVFTVTAQGVHLRVEADDLDWLARELSRCPFDFRVIEPADLCTALERQAQRLAGLAAPSNSAPVDVQDPAGPTPASAADPVGPATATDASD